MIDRSQNDANRSLQASTTSSLDCGDFSLALGNLGSCDSSSYSSSPPCSSPRPKRQSVPSSHSQSQVKIKRAPPSKYKRESVRKRSEDQSKYRCDKEMCTYPKGFSRNWELQRHIKSVHFDSKVRYSCCTCGNSKYRKDKLIEGCKKQHDWSADMVVSVETLRLDNMEEYHF